MAAPPAASLVARAALPPRLRPTTASPLGPAVLGPSSRRRYLRLRRSPSLAGTAAAAASSPSVPSSFPGPGPGIGDALGDVEIYSAATGEPVLFRDLWDQDEVETPYPSLVCFAPTREISVAVFGQRLLLKSLQPRRKVDSTNQPFCGLENTKSLLHKTFQ
jgi:hypothetical protein